MTIEDTKRAILQRLKGGRTVLKSEDFGVTPDELKQITTTLADEGLLAKHNMPMGFGVNAELTTEGRSVLEQSEAAR